MQSTVKFMELEQSEIKNSDFPGKFISGKSYNFSTDEGFNPIFPIQHPDFPFKFKFYSILT